MRRIEQYRKPLAAGPVQQRTQSLKRVSVQDAAIEKWLACALDNDFCFIQNQEWRTTPACIGRYECSLE
jgi:hypothetical protein